MTSKDDQLAAFLASPTPRRLLPPLIAKSAVQQAGPTSRLVLGVVSLLFSLFFVISFTPWEIFQDVRLRDAPTAPGRVEAVSPTRMKIQGVAVQRIEYSFQPPGQDTLQGNCFATGGNWSVGQRIAVAYQPHHPTLHCPVGARKSESEASGFLVWLFPLAGIIIIVTTFAARRRARWLLHSGTVAEARVTHVKVTPMRVNRRRVYAITLAFPNGQTITLRRHAPSLVEFAQARHLSQQPVFVLYDPAHPKRLLLPEMF